MRPDLTPRADGYDTAAKAPFDPERALALSYAPRESRAAVVALFDLDATLGQIIRTTREPLVGQMRLTWWHDALCNLDCAPPPAQPALQALAAEVLPRGVTGALLARMIDGWEALLDDPLDGAALARHAIVRGAGLFRVAAIVLGAEDRRRLESFGCGWAYADLANHLRDEAIAARARDRASVRLPLRLRHKPVGRTARPLGALALIARMDLSDALRPGSPRRVARLAWHRLSGR